MERLYFSCTLLTDIILNLKSSSEGPNKTLDFIPGGNFLGIVASNYDSFGDKALTVFHSGKVRFGDAHPANGNARTLKIPASYFHGKLDEGTYYNHHVIFNELGSEEILSKQLKQMRSGFYDLSKEPYTKVESPKSFAIKSAYDRENRRSKDSSMFGYESLQQGQTLLFEVEVDESINKGTVEKIILSLTGTRRLGRSRSAQYGLVKISKLNAPYSEVFSGNKPFEDNLHTVYADGRLIFMDGVNPIFRMTAADLGFESGEILFERSQLRTFQYAPYNGKRRTFDAERCGIEKGSVIVVKSDSPAPSESAYVGAFRNEGFGKVIYNPAFLSGENPVLGEKNAEVSAGHTETVSSEGAAVNYDNPLIAYLRDRRLAQEYDEVIQERVMVWKKKHASAFKDDSFASQFGAIRSLASSEHDFQTLRDTIEKYLNHGVAKEKWEFRRRKDVLLDFIDQEEVEKVERIPEEYVWRLVVNMASEMAKELSK